MKKHGQYVADEMKTKIASWSIPIQLINKINFLADEAGIPRSRWVAQQLKLIVEQTEQSLKVESSQK